MKTTRNKKDVSDTLLAELKELRQRVAQLENAEKLRKQAEEAITLIVNGLTSKIGETFFDSLAMQFASILNADYTLIGELVSGENESVRTLALCAEGRIVDNIEYELKDTPCKNVMGRRICSYKSGIASLFPNDPLLGKMDVEGYVGIPLFDSEDRPIGIMVALYKNPVEDTRFAESILSIFAARAASEIERQRFEGAMSESEEKFRQIVQSSPMGIFMYQLEPDDRLVFTGANPAADKILGLDNSQFIGKTIEEAFPPLKETEVPHRYRRAASLGEPWQTEQINYQDDKIVGAFEVYAFQTKPGAMACLFLDITSRKQVEKDLKQLRHLLSNIVNSMPSILIGVTPDGRVTQWNREAEKWTGIDADKANGKRLIDLLPQLEKEMEKVRLAIKNRSPQKGEKIPLIKNGDTIISDITVYPLIANEVEGAVIRIDDVTGRVAIEEMMIQSEKMLSVGGLAAGMAHEINNPLAGILQNTQVMINRVKSNLQKNRQVAEECGTSIEAIESYIKQRGIFSMLDSIIESGKRAAKIVQNMLSFSRKSESKFVPCNLIELLDNTVELVSNDYDLKKKYDFRRIEIVREYSDSTPHVMCESTKIQQVFLNILKNGAQAMAEKWSRQEETNGNDGEEQPQFSLRIIPENNIVRIEIEDNGPGMDETTRKRLFEPFYTTKGIGTGTGLGLSVSYFIITENHGGTMTVESNPGTGSTFIIRLPIQQETWARGAVR
jgi:PAS domain S-box-containing protein